MKQLKSIGCGIFLGLYLSACASNPQYTSDPSDPYQGYNRAMFSFNNGFYTYVANPVNDVYTTVTPGFFRSGVRNFFRNINTVPALANDALQWNWLYFGKDLVRLALNSTLGLFGLFDVAGSAGIPWHPQGFGYTLAKWGYAQSNYFILPILGPSTVSDTIGLGVDTVSSPVFWIEPVWARNTMGGVYFLQKSSDLLPQYNLINKTALDPYIALRESYMQNRAYNIQQIKFDGKVPEEQDPSVENGFSSLAAPPN